MDRFLALIKTWFVFFVAVYLPSEQIGLSFFVVVVLSLTLLVLVSSWHWGTKC